VRVFLGAAAGIFIWGYRPVGSRGESPGRGTGDNVSQKLKQFADIVYIF